MNLTQQVCVLADDLTGAADTAQYFSDGALPVRIVLPGTNLDQSESREPVLVYDTESREETLAIAANRMKRAIQQMLTWNPSLTRIYKKVDSTLRGNIGAEIETTLLELGRELAILAPAFPAHGRTVVGGVLLVDGVPVDETAFAQDPRHPMATAAIAELVRQTTTSLDVHQMSLEALRKGPREVERLLSSMSIPAVVIVDAKTTADLHILAAAVHNRTNCLPCGSAGLAESLALYWGSSVAQPASASLSCDQNATPRSDQNADQNADQNPSPSAVLPRCTAWMVLVGSAHPVSRAQLGVLNGNDFVTPVWVDPVSLAGPDRAKERRRVQSELALHRSPVVSMGFSTERPNLRSSNQDLAQDLGEFAAGWVLSALAESTQTKTPRAKTTKLAIIATGGATAVALCRALGVDSLLVHGEVMSGVPWSLMQVNHQEVVLITKAGGFGEANTLQNVIQSAMRRTEEER